MSDSPVQRQSVERLPEQRSTVITDELNKILDMLTGACPKGAVISFDFDGRLHVHIDVHSFEDLLKVEGILPSWAEERFTTPRAAIRRTAPSITA